MTKKKTPTKRKTRVTKAPAKKVLEAKVEELTEKNTRLKQGNRALSKTNVKLGERMQSTYKLHKSEVSFLEELNRHMQMQRKNRKFSKLQWTLVFIIMIFAYVGWFNFVMWTSGNISDIVEWFQDVSAIRDLLIK